MSAVRAGTTEGEGVGTGKCCPEAVAWGDMALWCCCTDRSLCNLVHCNGEVADSDQEGPVRVRERGGTAEKRVCLSGRSTERRGLSDLVIKNKIFVCGRASLIMFWTTDYWLSEN